MHRLFYVPGCCKRKEISLGDICFNRSQSWALSLERPLADRGVWCTASCGLAPGDFKSQQLREYEMPLSNPFPYQYRTVSVNPVFQQCWHESYREVSVKEGDRRQLSQLPPGNQKTDFSFVCKSLLRKKLDSLVSCKSGLEPSSWGGSYAWFGKQVPLYAKLIELGLQWCETALSFLGQVGYKNKCALLLCASSPG